MVFDNPPLASYRTNRAMDGNIKTVLTGIFVIFLLIQATVIFAATRADDPRHAQASLDLLKINEFVHVTRHSSDSCSGFVRSVTAYDVKLQDDWRHLYICGYYFGRDEIIISNQQAADHS